MDAWHPRLPRRYADLTPLGRGNFGTIWRAFDMERGEHVAVKVLNNLSRTNRRSFAQEARIGMEVDHPNLARVYDYSGGRQPYLAMELVGGRTIDKHVQARGHFTIAQTLDVADQVASGLEALHAADYVHRDVNAVNVMLDTTADAVKILDLGTAGPFDPSVRDASSGPKAMRDRAYAAPELLVGATREAHRGGPQSDVFALGGVMYKMLTGRGPAVRSRSDLLAARDGRAKTPPLSPQQPGLPSDVAALVNRMMETEPAKRPASASEVRTEIESLMSTVRSGRQEPTALLPSWLTVHPTRAAEPGQSESPGTPDRGAAQSRPSGEVLRPAVRPGGPVDPGRNRRQSRGARPGAAPPGVDRGDRGLGLEKGL